jgi:hypothetical protein
MEAAHPGSVLKRAPFRLAVHARDADRDVASVVAALQDWLEQQQQQQRQGHGPVPDDWLGLQDALRIACGMGMELTARQLLAREVTRHRLCVSLPTFGKPPLLLAATGSLNGMLAEEDRRARIVTMLLDAGADPDVVAPAAVRPGTALQVAVSQLSTPVVRALLQHPARRAHASASDLHAAVRCCNRREEHVKPIVELLLAAGVAADARRADDRNNTPLHVAARSCPHAAQLLLARHADVNARNDRGETPLHTSCNACCDAADVLLDAGASTDAPQCPTQDTCVAHKSKRATHGCMRTWLNIACAT